MPRSATSITSLTTAAANRPYMEGNLTAFSASLTTASNTNRLCVEEAGFAAMKVLCAVCVCVLCVRLSMCAYVCVFLCV